MRVSFLALSTLLLSSVSLAPALSQEVCALRVLSPTSHEVPSGYECVTSGGTVQLPVDYEWPLCDRLQAAWKSPTQDDYRLSAGEEDYVALLVPEGCEHASVPYAAVQVAIDGAGRFSNLKLDSCGDPRFDAAAVNAVHRLSPLPKPPLNRLVLRFGFYFYGATMTPVNGLLYQRDLPPKPH